MAQGKLNTAYFNPRTPRGVRPPPAGSHPHPYKDFMVDVFQSTHPARGATGAHLGRTLRRMISIHAPREGCDPAACPRSHSSSISIHAPREGCDYAGDQERKAHVRFQSTHPARGATRDRFDHGSTPLVISIHAPREGCDYNIGHGLKLDKISIHAPREGCDGGAGSVPVLRGNFNPRTPRGVRHDGKGD